MGRRKEVERAPVRRGSGNVFADLGLPNADELLAKATLASAITEALTARGLTQRAAAWDIKLDALKKYVEGS